eukprot:gene1437-833_t
MCINQRTRCCLRLSRTTISPTAVGSFVLRGRALLCFLFRTIKYMERWIGTLGQGLVALHLLFFLFFFSFLSPLLLALKDNTKAVGLRATHSFATTSWRFTRHSTMGKSFLEALKCRYGAEDDIASYDPSAFLVGDPHTFKGGKNKSWELVGMEKTRTQQSRYDRLFEVVLRDEDIEVALTEEEEKKTLDSFRHVPKARQTAAATPAPDGEPRKYNALEAENMSRLEELDLSANARLPLSEVGKLVPYFAQLRVLQLSDSSALFPPVRAALLPSCGPPPSPLLCSPRLEKLVLNNVNLRSFAPLLLWIQTPRLQELHLDHNQLDALPLLHDSDLQLGSSEGPDAVALRSQLSDALASALAQRRGEGPATDLFAFPSVRVLSLSGNQFHSWDDEDAGRSGEKEGAASTRPGQSLGEVLHRVFPALDSLFLTNNQLPDLPIPPRSLWRTASADHTMTAAGAPETVAEAADPRAMADDSETASYFGRHYAFLHNLKLLCLRENATIRSTATLDALRHLAPGLKTFRISYASLLSEWNETLARMYVVAALPSITTLNRGAVREKERLDSEIFYIQRGRRRQELERAGSVPSAADAGVMYPRLPVLEEKHRDLILSIYREGASAMMGEDGGAGGHLLLQVSLYPENLYTKNAAAESTKAGSAGAAHAVEKTLPSSLTIGKLKALIRVLFAVEPQHQQLRYQPGGDGGVMEVPIALDNELETLGYYGVTNGGKIGVTDTSLR